MSKIKNKFLQLKKKKERALIAYIMAGFPNEKTTMSAVKGLVKGGADIIEIGYPFSDPIADGPVIQNASTVSLNYGTKLDKFFQIIKKIRKETDIPLVLMTYTNILYKKGFDKFMQKAKSVGIDGFILPDMAIEESKDYLAAARKNHLDTIFLISPNTTTERIKKILKDTSGFLYLVSIFGTTGMQTKIQKYTVDAIKKTGDRVGYMHFADNTRHAPGQGQTNFKDILLALESIHFSGPIVAEVLPLPDDKTAVMNTAQFWKEMSFEL